MTAFIHRLTAALVFAGLLAASPTKAEIEKFMQQCQGKAAEPTYLAILSKY